MTRIVTVDSRTGRTRFFKTQGDNEVAVLQRINNGISANKGWKATDPLRYTLYGESSWVCPVVSNGEFQTLAIAHGSKTVKAYGKDRETALRAYRLELQTLNEAVASQKARTVIDVEVTVERKSMDFRDGNGVYLFTFREYPAKVLQGESRLSPRMPLAQPGDKVRVSFEETGEELETMTTFRIEPKK